MTAPPRPFALFAVRDRAPAGAPPTTADATCRPGVARDRPALSSTTSRSSGSAATPPARADARPGRVGRRGALLLLTGWTDYAFSSDNVAAHQAGLPLHAAVARGRGRGRALADRDRGDRHPGRPAADDRRRRSDGHVWRGRAARCASSTSMRIYWDQIAGRDARRATRRSPATARRRLGARPARRGFSAEVTPDGREPFGYDYARVSPASPWKLVPRPLHARRRRARAARRDRRPVRRLAAGRRDGAVLRRAALPPLPAGWTRTFLLHADGYSKEMDINSASPDTPGAAAVPRHDALPVRAARAATRITPEHSAVSRALQHARGARCGGAAAGRPDRAGGTP